MQRREECGVSIRRLLSFAVLPGYYNPGRFLVLTLVIINGVKSEPHVFLSQRQFRVVNLEFI